MHGMRRRPGRDAGLLQLVHPCVARLVDARNGFRSDGFGLEQTGITLVAMFAAINMRGDPQPWQAGECCVVTLGQAPAFLNDFGGPVHLRCTEGSLDVGHALVVAGVGMVGQEIRARTEVALQIAHRGAVVAQATQLFCKCVVLCRDHAAFAGGNGLARMKTETAGVTEGADMLIVVTTAEAAGGIFDNP